METTIDPVGNVAQRLHVVEGPPPPPPQLAAPTGLALTDDARRWIFNVTLTMATWLPMPPDTPARNGARQGSSGADLQTVNTRVSAPPHTFTP